ncbi:MAG: UMP kinase [Beggiatoa sp. IS2]|nr:MAG: UMP kinase [Beggiatoa sp. IS2]
MVYANNSNESLTYRRILLKLSGEALMGDRNYGIDPQVLTRLAEEIHAITCLGVQVGIVIGGGNIFRGVNLTAQGLARVSADYVGMLATVMNAVAMQDVLSKCGLTVRMLSALSLTAVCEDYTWQRAIHHLQKGYVVIFAAGTGNPFFTTDSAASLRAVEIQADLMIKATKVNGIYASDPVINPQAERYTRLSYDDVLTRQLGVMDLTAVLLCRDHGIPLRVLDMSRSGALLRAVKGEDEGTLVCVKESEKTT